MEPVKRQQPESEKQATLEKVRPELNLEKWPVWHPTNSRSAPKPKILKREVELPDGTKAIAQVRVGFTDQGMLTTDDQKVLYALVRQWELRGKESEFTFFSLQGLAKTLRRQWGKNVIESLQRSLLRLRVTPFYWKNAYYDKSSKETVSLLDPFSILSDLKIIKRSSDGHVTKAAGYFKFNDFILNNLRTNHTKPIILDVVMAFKSDIAQLLYLRLDLLLSNKTRYERCTKELFEDLALEGKAYKNISNRRQILERALKELRGKPISTGTISTAILEPTKDGSDYKLVVTKSRAMVELEDGAEDNREEMPVMVSEPQAKNEERVQAEELVKLYFQLFHKAEQPHIESRALGQAYSILTRCGYENAKFVIEYAHREAPKTNFIPKTFGGILQYENEALAARESEVREAAKREADTRARQEADALKAETERLNEAYQTYRTQVITDHINATYAPEVFLELVEKKKQELTTAKPGLFTNWEPETIKTYTLRMIRADLAATIPMDSFEEFCAKQQGSQTPEPAAIAQTSIEDR
jgi:hypothetical protein